MFHIGRQSHPQLGLRHPCNQTGFVLFHFVFLLVNMQLFAPNGTNDKCEEPHVQSGQVLLPNELDQRWKTLSAKGQVLRTLAFMGPAASVTARLCSRPNAEQPDSTETNGRDCVLISRNENLNVRQM